MIDILVTLPWGKEKRERNEVGPMFYIPPECSSLLSCVLCPPHATLPIPSSILLLKSHSNTKQKCIIWLINTSVIINFLGKLKGRKPAVLNKNGVRFISGRNQS